ncbi:MAG TPA: aminotransferase class I/II-fold pyridoxal phosphate-dependent enzyme [Baekduia sp.]
MSDHDNLLGDGYARRLAARAQTLLPLGTLNADAAPDDPAAAAALAELAARLRDTYPYNDPRYAGQMLKPPVPVAWAAYATAMLLNPNNHALDGGPATAAMEKEVVAALGDMLGVASPRLGHLTSSGTIANLEALFVARELAGADAVVVSSEAAHYTHARMCGVLGVPHETIAQDGAGRMDAGALRDRLARGGVGTVVATLGTTGLGALDPLPEIADLCAEFGARLHVDTAYGGFFALLADGGAPGVDVEAYKSVARADSVVIDPHKHGLQPYGCGCVLFSDPSVGRFYAHDSPYTYFTSGDLHLGEISLECSRAGASAAALWTTLRALPLTRDGLGQHLAAARGAGLRLAELLAADERVALLVEPELDIVCVLARAADDPGAAAERAFDDLAREGWHVATLRVDRAWATARHPWLADRGGDPETVTAIRCCLLKREHAGVVDALAGVLIDAL